MHSLRNLPPLDGLMTLLAAAETGSFTAAADALQITHGSVSRRIAGLEAWLGTSLFDRHGRGVRLTPAGQRFAADARRSLDDLSRSADHWRPWRGRQTVRLTVVPAFARLWLMPRLAALERDDIHVDLTLDHKATELDRREADLAIRYGRGPWDGLDARLLLCETLVPAASPAIAARLLAASAPAASAPSATAAALLAEPLLHDSDVMQWRTWLNAAGLRYRPRWQDRRFEDYDSVLTAAAAGLGICLLRLPLAGAWIDSGQLAIVSSRVDPNPSGHYLCRRVGEEREAVIALADRLLDCAGQSDIAPVT